tara:strand:+ start:298 stop:1152 length:855 start_codon:yes stop_codon:yes gene_type:complete
MSLIYTLRKKDEGQEVQKLQRAVSAQADGKFGPKTEKLLKEYQEEHSLLVDGIAGPHTLGHMGNEVVSAVDLSAWNGTVDFKKMKAAGVKHAWIKITEGQTHRNRGYQKKFDDARAEGFSCGAYHFGRSDNPEDSKDWEREATNFLLQLEKAGLECGDLVPVLDVEKGMKTDDNHNVDWCLKWLEMVANETKTTPLIYTAKWAHDLFLARADKENLKKLFEYPVWWARYIRKSTGHLVGPGSKLRGWKEWHAWQYTGHGSIDGAKGRVDLNWIAGGQLEKLRVP